MPPKYRQTDLWGNPVAKAKPSTEIMPLSFEGHKVRMVLRRGEPWWAATDVCRLLGIGNASLAVMGNPSRSEVGGLDEDERAVCSVNTPSGEQQMLCINESGLYALIFKSRKPDAKRFRKWVTSEVLPSIRKTGSYKVRDLVAETQKRLKCDLGTAKKRRKVAELNVARNGRLNAEGADRDDYRDFHNAGYRGLGIPEGAAGVRKILGLKSWRTPLDHMDSVALSIIEHAGIMAERKLRDAAENDQPIPLEHQPSLVEETTNHVASDALKELGREYILGVTEHPRRGRILDVVRRQIEA